MHNVDGRIAAIAGRQYGVIRRDQLLAAGLTSSALVKREARGLLHRVFTAVYAVGHAVLSRESRWMAAVLAGGEDAALSHLSAALLLGIWRGAAPVCDVIAPRRSRLDPGLRIHRYRRVDAADIIVVKRIPVTTVPRTLVDLTDVLGPMQLANVMHEAAFRRIFNAGLTRAAMERAHGRHRLGVLAEALDAHERGSAGTRNSSEDDLLALIVAAGLPPPLVNVPVLIAGRRIEVDFQWPDQRVCVELDGPGHARPRTRREDRVRDELLRAAGWRILRIPLIEFEQRPQEVLALLCEALRL
jgi:hypothetical protein